LFVTLSNKRLLALLTLDDIAENDFEKTLKIARNLYGLLFRR